MHELLGQRASLRRLPGLLDSNCSHWTEKAAIEGIARWSRQGKSVSAAHHFLPCTSSALLLLLLLKLLCESARVGDIG